MTLSNNLSASWSSPSNIALVKYWGKHGIQLPCNPSISFTLSNCKTETKVELSKKNTSDEFSYEIYFEGKKSINFRKKIDIFFERISSMIPFIKEYHLDIYSENTFPHSTGIASSASGMSALSLCLVDLDSKLKSEKLTEDEFIKKSSILSRIGSGSASRSVIPRFGVWGKSSSFENSSDEYAIEAKNIHEIFNDYHDSVLIISSKEKEVSSTVGHGLMNNHPFSKVRYENASNNLNKLYQIMKEGDLFSFCDIVEKEALELHGLMMNSEKSFILMKPETLNVIFKVRAFRKENNIPLCFTLDAGPNVHLLYPSKYSVKVHEFIENELIDFSESRTVIHDKVGLGPKRL